jgi:hypothetical protein
MQIELDISEDGESIQMTIVDEDKEEFSIEIAIEDCRGFISALADCMIKATEIRESLRSRRKIFN